MKSRIGVIVVLVASALGGVAAHAATYNFTFTQPETSGTYTAATGMITTADTASSDGGFSVTAISGSVYGNAISGLDGSAELYANNSSEYVNETGISVTVPKGYNSSPYTFAYGPEVSDAPVGAQDYQLYTAFGGSLPGSFNITASGASSVSAAPEPGSWALLLGGVGAMGLMLRRRRSAALTA